MTSFNVFSFYEKLPLFLSSTDPHVMVTLVNVRGSAPQDIGAKMLVSPNGIELGTVGGGKIEKRCIDFAINLLETSEITQSMKWNLQSDIGMTCGGEVEILFEKISSQDLWDITIFGAGHVSQALVKILVTLNCNITVIDQRQDWVDKLPKHKRLRKIVSSNPCELVEELNSKTFLLSLTMGHAFDVPILAEAFKNRDFPFIGAIGSKVKRKHIENDLVERGISKDSLKYLHCPVGEKIGTNQPEEIAISIVAQLIKARDSYFK